MSPSFQWPRQIDVSSDLSAVLVGTALGCPEQPVDTFKMPRVWGGSPKAANAAHGVPHTNEDKRRAVDEAAAGLIRVAGSAKLTQCFSAGGKPAKTREETP
jgi:hypothetical protein